MKAQEIETKLLHLAEHKAKFTVKFDKAERKWADKEIGKQKYALSQLATQFPKADRR